MTRTQVLHTAIKAAIANNCDRKDISVPAWSETYGVTQKLVREIWESELTKQTNASSIGDGK